MTPEIVKKIILSIPGAKTAYKVRNDLINGLDGNKPPKPNNPFADPSQRKNKNPNSLGTPRY